MEKKQTKRITAILRFYNHEYDCFEGFKDLSQQVLERFRSLVYFGHFTASLSQTFTFLYVYFTQTLS